LTTYQFEAQLRKGEAYEAVLDNFFREKFDIQPVQMCDQRRGIDRIFTSKKNGSILKIEYKADSKAAQTGNAFIETVSVDTQQKPGWAVYSEADYLIYYIPPLLTGYVIQMDRLKGKVDLWKERHATRSIPNRGYNTIGVLVPLREFEQLAITVISPLPASDWRKENP